MISLSKIFILSGILFGDWAISVSFCKFFLFSCVKTPIYVRGEKQLGKLTLKSCYSIVFGLWAENTWIFSKTVKHGFQNCSLRVQRNIFRNFSEATIIEWKFWVFERKDQISCESFYSGLPKAQFTCPVEHFEEKMIKVNFTACGLLGLCVIISYSDWRFSPGCQNHKLGVQSGNKGRISLSQMFFQNIFRFWAEELGNLAENYWQGCQNCKLRAFRRFLG